MSEAIAAQLVAAGDSAGELTEGDIDLLRAGDGGTPPDRHLEFLAVFFKVPITYFAADAETVARIEAQVALLAAMADGGVPDVAFRAAGRSADNLASMAAILRQAHKQGGDDVDPPVWAGPT